MKPRTCRLPILLAAALAMPAHASTCYEEGPWTPLASLDVAAGETLSFAPPDCMMETACNTWLLLDVPGDVRIDGTIDASAWRLGIRTPGRLDLNGTINVADVYLDAGTLALHGNTVPSPFSLALLLATPHSTPIPVPPLVFDPVMSYDPSPISGFDLPASGGFALTIALVQPSEAAQFVPNDIQALAQPVPEPAEYATLLGSLGILGVLARRRRAV